MKRFGKILIIIAAIGFVLIGAVAVGLQVFLRPEKVKAMIVEQLSSRLHREVRLESVSIGLWQGVRLTQFALSEPSTFAKGTFVSSEEARLQVSLLPLLAKKIVIEDLSLIHI